jgi:osmotically-inducible protein OsmY
MKTDKQIHLDVLEALKFDPQIREQAIAVAVKDGIVTLNGEVESHAQKVAAEQVVKRIIGVRGVSDKIIVKPHVAPTDVKDKIVKAFERSARQEAQDVRVKVAGGIITLEGSVPTWAEYDEAEHAAWSAAGVSEVRNLLVVNARTPLSSAIADPA